MSFLDRIISVATHWPFEACCQANDFTDTGKRKGDKRKLRCNRCQSTHWVTDEDQGTWKTTYRGDDL